MRAEQADREFKNRIEGILQAAGRYPNPKAITDQIFNDAALDWLERRKEAFWAEASQHDL